MTNGPRQRRRGEEGYNMVLLMVLVTTLNVLVAAALPAWSTWTQREAEEELIFRGLQYAEAIRVFQARFGRLPVQLDELVVVEPRSIRQLWSDPLTGEERWGLLFGDPSNPQNCNPSPAEAANAGGLDNGREVVTQGPICGVYSLAEGDSIKTFLGSNTYSEWKFTLGLLVAQGGPQQQQQQQGQELGGGLGGGGGAAGGAAGGQAPPPQAGQPPGNALMQAGVAPNLSMRWIGRPWPAQIQSQLAAQGTAGIGQGNLPGGGLDAPQNDGRGDGGSIFDRDDGGRDGDGDDGDDGGGNDLGDGRN